MKSGGMVKGGLIPMRQMGYFNLRIILTAALIACAGCATTVRMSDSDYLKITQGFVKKLTPEEARQSISALELGIVSQIDARLSQDPSPSEKEALLLEHKVLVARIAKLQEQLEQSILAMREGDEIWSYETGPITQDGRGGQSGIVIARNGRIVTRLTGLLRD